MLQLFTLILSLEALLTVSGFYHSVPQRFVTSILKSSTDNEPTNLNRVQQNNLIKIAQASAMIGLISTQSTPATASAASTSTVATEFKLPPLPYKYDALEPYISSKTLSFHHDKHHAKYVSTTNTLIKNTGYEKLASLEDIILQSYTKKNQGLFNNAAQAWNHDFYWKCMTSPNVETNFPSMRLLNAIDNSFGSIDKFKEQVCMNLTYIDHFITFDYS